MPVDFITKSINLGTRNPNGSKRQIDLFTEHTFNKSINKASVALNGFRLNFTESDHDIRDIQVDSDAIIDNKNTGTVTARIQILFADSGYDDPFKGFVTVVIFVEY